MLKGDRLGLFRTTTFKGSDDRVDKDGIRWSRDDAVVVVAAVTQGAGEDYLKNGFRFSRESCLVITTALSSTTDQVRKGFRFSASNELVTAVDVGQARVMRCGLPFDSNHALLTSA
jgi:hypothetical protein